MYSWQMTSTATISMDLIHDEKPNALTKRPLTQPLSFQHLTGGAPHPLLFDYPVKKYDSLRRRLLFFQLRDFIIAQSWTWWGWHLANPALSCLIWSHISFFGSQTRIMLLNRSSLRSIQLMLCYMPTGKLSLTCRSLSAPWNLLSLWLCFGPTQLTLPHLGMLHCGQSTSSSEINQNMLVESQHHLQHIMSPIYPR